MAMMMTTRMKKAKKGRIVEDSGGASKKGKRSSGKDAVVEGHPIAIAKDAEKDVARENWSAMAKIEEASREIQTLG